MTTNEDISETKHNENTSQQTTDKENENENNKRPNSRKNLKNELSRISEHKTSEKQENEISHAESNIQTDESKSSSVDETNDENINQSESFVDLNEKQNDLSGSGNSIPSEKSKCSETSENRKENEKKSGQVKEIRTTLEDDDMDEYDPDLYITEEERKAFEYMIEQRREEIVKQRNNFQQWVDSLTKRRMFALSRSRKISKSHQERMKFYDKINDYIKTAENVIKSDETTHQQIDFDSDGFHKESNNQKFEDMVRENTGFLIRTGQNTEKSVDSSNSENAKLVNNDNTTATKHTNEKEALDNNNITKTENFENNGNGNEAILQNADDDAKRNITSNNENTPKIVQVQS